MFLVKIIIVWFIVSLKTALQAQNIKIANIARTNQLSLVANIIPYLSFRGLLFVKNGKVDQFR